MRAPVFCRKVRQSLADPCPAVGDGRGDSVTEWPELFFCRLGLVLDCPGYDDNQLRFTAREAAQRVAMGVAGAGVTQLKFLVFDSVANDLMRLRPTLAELQASFGSCIMDSVVVVASKMNEKPGETGEKKLRGMKQVMAEQGLSELVPWYGPALNESSLSQLQAALGRVPSVSIAELDGLWARQQRRAAELHGAQVPHVEHVSFEVEQNRTEERQVHEPYNHTWPEIVSETEWFQRQKCETKQVAQQVKLNKCRVVDTETGQKVG
ncbi:unnamed protein product [Effrenium voratum]|nr:unnamed protein product [Effrenium voratum]